MALTPVGRMGTTENIAGLVSYLVSDEADFVTGGYCFFLGRISENLHYVDTGQSLSINGGAYYD